jgi:cytochrome c-type biogenesis protein CcmI
MEIFVVLLVLVAVALFVLPPLFKTPSSTAGAPASAGLAEAASRRDAAYEGLAELEQDRSARKVSDEDYSRSKLGLQREALEALRDLDTMTGGRASRSTPGRTGGR